MATRVGANRIVRGGQFHHPFGKPDLLPDEEYAWRCKFVNRILDALGTPVQQHTVFDVEAETLV